MIQETDLQELVEFDGGEAPFLSVYLNTDPHRRTTEKYKLALRRLLSSVHSEADRADLERVERYVDLEYNWQGKSVVCFSCQAAGFWRAFSLPVPVEDRIVVGRRPYVKPLTDLMDTFARYGVAVVGREGTRLFVFHLGELEEAGGTLGEDVKRHKQGGWAATRYQRHVDGVAFQNLKEAAEEAASLFQEKGCKWILLGGTEENVAQFQSLLPKVWQDRVAGQFAIDVNASPTEVQERSVEIAQAVADQEREKLVEQVITAATKGGAGAIGLNDTLAALQEGRIYQLVVADGFQAPGQRCPHCGYLGVEGLEVCPFCNNELEPVQDIVNAAVRRALEQGVDTITVRNSEALARAGHIGAVLRY